MRMRVRKWATSVALVAVLAITGFAASGCVTGVPRATWNNSRVDPTAEYAFSVWIREARALTGRPGPTLHGTLINKGRAWSNAMSIGWCSGGAVICHSQLSHGISGHVQSWSLLGENVGVGSCSNLPALWYAFMTSPGHRANILDPRWQYAGVGVVRGEHNRCYVTMEFMRA